MFIKVTRNSLLLIITISLLLPCIAFATADEFDDLPPNSSMQYAISDPFEQTNRSLLNRSLSLFEHVITPVFDIYEKHIPISFRLSLKNIGENYTITPSDITYSILDFDVEAATVSLWRLLINSTIGIFGAFDVASSFGLISYGKSFDYVMHFYGIPSGTYHIIPFFGPKTTRAAFSIVVDLFTRSPLLALACFGYAPFFADLHSTYLNPLYQFSIIHNIYLAKELTHMVFLIGMFQNANDKIKQLSISSIDTYEWMKLTYIQNYHKNIERYDRMRTYKTLPNRNMCDNDFEIMNDNRVDECNFDAKQYTINNY